MPFPYSITIFGSPVLLHSVLETIGIFVAFRYYLWLKKRKGDTVEKTNRLAVVTAAIFGAVFGSHLIGALENAPQWLHSPHFWQYFYGNKTLVGGLAGGLVFVEVTKKMIGERQATGDLFVFPLLLGMIIGRLGCFSAGVYEETYGFPTKLPWGMDLGDGLLRHPVTLYEILFLMLLWFVMAQLSKRKPLQQGAIYKLFLIAYLTFRLLLDFIKPGWRFLFGLGTIQLTCITGLLYYSRYIIHPKLLFKTYAG